MARRRMIDPNFWESEDIATLTLRQRLLFIGLFSNADDEGRLRGKSTFIRSTVFPYDDITLKEIEDDLKVIAKLGSIIRYEVDNNSYIQIKNWKRFQRVDKPRPSILPAFDVTLSDNNSENDSKNDSDIDSGLKENKEKIKEAKEKEVVEENAREDAAAAADKELLKSIQTILQDSGILSPSLTEVAEIYRWLREQKWDIDMFAQASKDMALGNKRQVKYITKIFKRWSDSGFKTLADVLADKDDFERKKTGKKPAHSPPKDDGKFRHICWS